MEVVILVEVVYPHHDLFGYSFFILYAAPLQKYLQLEVKVHHCCDLVRDLGLLFVVVEHLDATHDIFMFEYLQTRDFPQTTEIDALAFGVGFLVDLNRHVLGIHLSVLLKNIEGRLERRGLMVFPHFVEIDRTVGTLAQ